MGRDHWYFAYGSNLSVDQKARRTGHVREVIRCRLPGFRLAFNKRSVDGTIKANVVEDASREVWGVAYRCDEAAMAAMDRWEGAGYRRRAVQVITGSGRRLDAVTYVATRIDPEGAPHDDYLRLILGGAEHHRLPKSYIRDIERLARLTGSRDGSPPRDTP